MTQNSVRFLPLLFLIALVGCKTKKKSELVWNKSFYQIGSQSSPRATDLNKDGVLDIVMGTGLNEYQQTEFGIIAVDGETGELLWKQVAPDQVYGSATFYDVNGDGVDDVFIGGRSPHFKALDGKTGRMRRLAANRRWDGDQHHCRHTRRHKQ